MNSKDIFLIGIGIAIGSIATCKLIQKKYDLVLKDDSDDFEYVNVKENTEEDTDFVKEDSESNEKISVSTYINKLRERSNTVDYTEYAKKELSGPVTVNEPRIITSEEFDEDEEYSKIGLIYYADDVLTDTDNEIVEDIDDVIGFDNLEKFEDMERTVIDVDSFYVRNYALRSDYEIIRNSNNYSDCADVSSYPTED